MPATKKKTSSLKLLGRRFESVVTDLSQALSLLIKRPFGQTWRTGKKDRMSKGVRWSKVALWPISLLIAVFSVFGRVLISPAELLVGLFHRKSSEVLWTIPWIIGFVSLLTFLYIGWSNGDARRAAMRKKALGSFIQQDYETAAARYENLIQASSNPMASDLLHWSLALSRIGKEDKASEILGQLAPGIGSNPGYEEAHQLVAISIAAKMKKPINAVILKNLRWHLDCSGPTLTPELNRAWAEYYLAVKNEVSALRFMILAAEVKPEFMVMVADIYGSLGDTAGQRDALERANVFFQQLVQSDPPNPSHRIMLARILIDLGRIDSAEQVLLDGIGRDKEGESELRSACADLYLKLYRDSDPDGDFAERFSFLKKSLNYDPNHIPTYDYLIRFYRSVADNDQSDAGKQIVAILRESITSDDSPALAHLALSNILWVEEQFDESQFHMEKAFELDSRFVIIANNLAWLLAHANPPDLDRAFELSSQVVQQHPEVGRFDTLATILMKQKKYEQALAEFQKALPTMRDKKKVHENMALIYGELGKHDLAQHHQQRADAEPDIN